MPAINMAGSGGSNPSTGSVVIHSPFSGPKGSPFDAFVYDPTDPVGSQARIADPLNLSTGALSTGIGFGPNCRVPGMQTLFDDEVPASVNDFSDSYQPGITMPDGTDATEAILLAIGGGNMTYPEVDPGMYPDLDPYLVQPLLAFGNGGARDAGSGPAYTGFGMKVVTASGGTVANGSAIETGWTNRSGVTLPDTESQFGVSTTASPEVTSVPPEPPPPG